MSSKEKFTVSKLLKETRKRRKLTQIDVSDLLGLTSGQMISKIERRTCWVHLNFAKKLCKALKIPKKDMIRALQCEIEERF